MKDSTTYREQALNALHKALSANTPEAMEYWLKLGFSPLLPLTEKAETALHLAAPRGRGSVMGVLLSEPGIRPDQEDEIRQTPIMHAARHGNLETVNALLQFNADLYSLDLAGRDALIHAAIGGDAQVIALLLKQPKAHQFDTSRAALEAASHGHAAALALLLPRCVDPNIQDAQGNGLLHWAVEYGFQPALVADILEEGTNPTLANSEGKRASDLVREIIVAIESEIASRQTAEGAHARH